MSNQKTKYKILNYVLTKWKKSRQNNDGRISETRRKCGMKYITLQYFFVGAPSLSDGLSQCYILLFEIFYLHAKPSNQDLLTDLSKRPLKRIHDVDATTTQRRCSAQTFFHTNDLCIPSILTYIVFSFSSLEHVYGTDRQTFIIIKISCILFITTNGKSLTFKWLRICGFENPLQIDRQMATRIQRTSPANC